MIAFDIALGIALGLGFARAGRVLVRYGWTWASARVLARVGVQNVPAWYFLLDDLLGPTA